MEGVEEKCCEDDKELLSTKSLLMKKADLSRKFQGKRDFITYS
jgi:hypothetical protein